MALWRLGWRLYFRLKLPTRRSHSRSKSRRRNTAAMDNEQVALLPSAEDAGGNCTGLHFLPFLLLVCCCHFRLSLLGWLSPVVAAINHLRTSRFGVVRVARPLGQGRRRVSVLLVMDGRMRFDRSVRMINHKNQQILQSAPGPGMPAPIQAERATKFTWCAVAVAVAQWLAHSPPTKVIRVRSPAGSLPDFRMRESCVQRAFSGHSRFLRPCIPAPLHPRVSFHVMFRDDGYLRRFAHSPPTKANQFQSSTRPLLNFRNWESCRTMPLLIDWFSRGSPISSIFKFRRCSIFIPLHTFNPAEGNGKPPRCHRLARSPPTKANRAQSSAGAPDFRKWESCRTIPLVGGFSRGCPVYPPHLHSSATQYSLQSPSSALETSLLRYGPNLFTPVTA
ncbi:hypothetical protein PR048_024814 [Dryococelus australis]|uniref:Uncharacterized protein n=1 Tax=Dryococelus australis TaxID=614101 RepID=A0ABQ9GPP6_9NEOP|nr:hypothetical protein PR048_024814 [Dryococelus australis]